MILLRNEIESALAELLNTLTGESWIKANPAPTGDPDTPRPQGLYGSVHVSNLIETGIGDYIERVNQDVPDVDLIESFSGHRLLQISINTYRQGAFDLMNSLYNKLQRTSVTEYLIARNLSYAGRSDMRDLALQISTTLEERYQMDLSLYTVASDEEVIFAIQSLTVTGTIDNGAQQLAQINIEVNNA